MPVIAFSSPKGGVGKSTLAAHVAAILSQRGFRVTALDLDPQNALRLHFGAPIAYEAGFMASIDSPGSAWRSAVVQTKSGVDLLPYGVVEPRRAIDISSHINASPDLLTGPVHEICADPGRILVIDTPPGPSAALDALMPEIDLCCLVLLADAGSAAILPGVAAGQVFGRGTLAARWFERVGVVMNQVDISRKLSAAVLDCADRTLGRRLLAAVCDDEALAEALAHKRLLVSGGTPGADDLQVLVDRIASRLHLNPPASSSTAPAYAALDEWGLH